jgi:hypothetical protein
MQKLMVLSLLPVGMALLAQQPTLRQLIAETHADLGVTKNAELPPIRFATVLNETDLIVRGKLGNGVGRLSPDELDVFTTYPIVNPEILFPSTPDPYRTPGMAPVSLSVSVKGGTAIVDGYRASVHHDDTPDLVPGLDMILLLQTVKDQHWIAGHGAGAFIVRESKVLPAMPRRGEHHQFVDRDVQDFLNDVIAWRRAR